MKSCFRSSATGRRCIGSKSVLKSVGLLLLLLSPIAAQEIAAPDALVISRESTNDGDISRGHYEVFEDRQSQAGRRIKLNIVILHTMGEDPRPDPIFVMAGGPGQAAARLWGNGFANHWMRQDRDIVLVSQRGTDLDNNLAFVREGPATSLQQYLEPFLKAQLVQQNLERLKQVADLTRYSTPIAMDDLNEVRAALGYEKINLMGGSYGTRASLVYIRRHEATVRCAILDGCAPIEFRNPLFHAEGAQRALDMLFDEVEGTDKYRKAFPDLRTKFSDVLQRFDDEGPRQVEIQIQGTGETEIVRLNRENFVDALRYQMYYLGTSRRVPLLIEQAWQGNFKPFAISVIQTKRALGNSIATGMLLSVTSAEDVARIDPDEIETVTGDSYLGAARVYRQLAAAKIWPRSSLPDSYGDPVKSTVPVLIFSGELDPVTPPKWGQMVADNFPHSLHVVAPAAHGVHGPCPDSLRQKFLETASVQGLDTSCIDKMQLPPLALPDE